MGKGRSGVRGPSPIGKPCASPTSGTRAPPGARRSLLRRSSDPVVEYWAGSKVVFEVDNPIACEADGDIEGMGTHFEFSVVPGAMLVIAPRTK